MECINCRKELTKRQLQKKQVFCSMDCNRAAKAAKLHPCITCKVNLTKSKFCSRSCSAKTNNIGKRRHGLATNSFGVVRGACGNCGKETPKFFCDNTCFSQFTTELKAYAWLTGDTAVASAPNGEIKIWLLDWQKKKCDYTCQNCGWRKFHPVDGKPGVQVDHINGNNKDHRPENIRVLCPNCHWETETYCGRNKKRRP